MKLTYSRVNDQLAQIGDIQLSVYWIQHQWNFEVFSPHQLFGPKVQTFNEYLKIILIKQDI